MKKIIFRCDASISIGSGHVIRCRTLARELRRRGFEVSFLCRRQPGDLIGLLELDFPVIVLPEQCIASCDGLQGRDLYRAWLGCTQDQDAAQCLEALHEAGIQSPSWLVTDHYGLDVSWETQLIAGCASVAGTPKMLVIDDLADRPHQADLLLDQNFYGTASDHRYRGLVPAQCTQFLGPQYALLGPEYAHFHPLTPPRTELRRVLVFFGGVDLANLTAQALEALLDPAVRDLAVDVVLGLQSSHRTMVDELVAARPNTTLHGPLASLAGLMVRADLAIGAVGSTTWERACMGLPCISVPFASNQIPVSKALAQHDYIRLVEPIPEVFRSKLLDELAFFSRSDNIKRFSLANSLLTRGEGCQICADNLLRPKTNSSLKLS